MANRYPILQAACREAGGTKPKVLINLSLSGIKVADLKTKVVVAK